MVDTFEQTYYSSHQIIIPPNLPTILKKYAKAAIRTQPYDLLVWSASYFKALTYGIPLPIKQRIEYPPVQTISGLTPGFIKVLINQIGNNFITVSREEVIDYWNGVCLSKEGLEEIFSVGGFGLEINWLKFIAICTGYIEACLTRTMVLLCELLTDEPPGGSAHIPINKFMYLYKYLARMECGPNPPQKKEQIPQHSLKRSKLNQIEVGDELEDEISLGITYKDGEADDLSIKTESAITWKSVLRRMGKRESERSASTIDLDKEYNKADILTRGIMWKRVLDIEDSEPDSNRTSYLSEGGDSEMGLQIFETHDDKLKTKKVIPSKEVDELSIVERTSGYDKKISDPLERSDAKIDLAENIGEKSLKEIENLLEEFDTTTKIKETTVKEIEIDTESKITISTSGFSDLKMDLPIMPDKLKIEIPLTRTDQILNELVKPDSSIGLVPTPPRGDYADSFEDIKEIDEEEKFSTGELLEETRGRHSLHDVRIPQIDIPILQTLQETDEPKKVFVHEQKWVHIPGIGPKVDEEQIKTVGNYMEEVANKQSGAVMPRNIRHFFCPPLDPPGIIEKENINI